MEEKKHMEYISSKMPQRKYYREEPIRIVDSKQTMYQAIKNLNIDNMNYNSIGYMNHNYTYEEMLREVDKTAIALKQLGVKENDVVLIAMVSTPEVAKILLAINKIGAVSKWIDLRVKSSDLEYYINEHHSKYIIAFDMLIPIIQQAINNTDVENAIIVKPTDSLSVAEKLGYILKSKIEGSYNKLPKDKRFIYFSDLLNIHNKNIDISTCSFDKDKPSLIIQSSGTTGMAKSIIHTDYTINESIYKLCYSDLPFYKGNRILVTVPPWIGYGLINSYYLSLAMGMQAVLCPKVDRDTVFKSLGKFDLAFAAPLHYRYLAELIDKCDDLSMIQALITGGDKITAEELREIRAILTRKGFNGEILNGYGNNEGLGAETVNPITHNKLGSVGIPLYGNVVAAFDENNRELKINELGELCVKTSTMFVEYAFKPEETDKIKQLHEDGEYWIHTGDLGRVDEDGFVHVEGRLRRVIIRRAFKIFPGTIEKTIKKHKAVKECITVGINDAEELSVPMAFIVLNDDLFYDENVIIEELKLLCEKELKDYEIPAYFSIITEIPYTQNNKQDFRKLEQIGNEKVGIKSKVLEKTKK